MEERKRREIEYYDAEAVRQRVSSFVPSALGSYQFLYKVATPWIKGKKVLDYGCGDGRHTQFLAEHAKEVIGIDLSERSLEIAKKIAVREGVEEKVKFLKMDCEAMEFPDNSFDVVFDGGTFSSLDFEKAIGEILRKLRFSISILFLCPRFRCSIYQEGALCYDCLKELITYSCTFLFCKSTRSK